MAESQKTDENSSKEEYTETVNVSAVCSNFIFILSKNIF